MMQTALMISAALSWAALLALGAICLALVRQVGILYERMMPAGALMIDKGPAVGAIAPTFELADIAGRAVKVGGMSAGGAQHAGLLPLADVPRLQEAAAAAAFDPVARRRHGHRARKRWRHHRTRRVLSQDRALAAIPYVLSQELGLAYQIGKLPYAVLLDDEGKVRAKGLVNTREHLESLFEAKERGVASLQEFVHGKAHERTHDRMTTKAQHAGSTPEAAPSTIIQCEQVSVYEMAGFIL